MKASCESIGIQAILTDFARTIRHITLCTDAQAAMGTVSRLGLGKLRHISVGMLWLQQKEAKKTIRFTKVKGTENPADLMTKGGIDAESLGKYMTKMSFESMIDRQQRSLRPK